MAVPVKLGFRHGLTCMLPIADIEYTGDNMCSSVFDVSCRPVFSESLLGFGVSSGEFLDGVFWCSASSTILLLIILRVLIIIIVMIILLIIIMIIITIIYTIIVI